MNRERLEMIRVMLERVVAGSWVPGTNAMIEAVNLDTWREEQDGCGYTACAVGHACFDQAFNQLGLHWAGRGVPAFGDHIGWAAVDAFFDIGRAVSYSLFAPDDYSKKVREKYSHLPSEVREAKMVADRIQKLLDKGRV